MDYISALCQAIIGFMESEVDDKYDNGNDDNVVSYKMQQNIEFTSKGGIDGMALCGLNWIDTRAVVGFLNQS